jgi:hypothetical protein
MKLDRSKHSLIVEGMDDLYVIANVLERSLSGVDLDKMICAPKAQLGDSGAVGAAIRLFVNTLATQKHERVALVLDANGDIERRRDEIRAALKLEGLVVADLAKFGGLREGHVAGVWLMPDNLRPGALEDFLQPMIEPSALADWANEATTVAQAKKAAPFRDHAKASLRTWLSWQAQPGLPPGEAVKRGLLRSEPAAAFVSWFLKLFAVEVR